MKITGNTILITGGATGIGFALAEHFIGEGNKVIICGRRKSKLDEAKKKLPQIETRVADISTDSGRKELIVWVIKNFPSFNVLVNNAGIQQLIFLKRENSNEIITEEIATNLAAPLHLTNLVVHHFLLKNKAAIINISSGLGFIPLAIAPVYCATKAALHSFSISSRFQLKDTSIRIFEIIPPIVETELGKDNSRKERDVKGITPDEVATETLQALKADKFEYPVGMAAGLYNASRSNDAYEVFKRING